MNMSIRKNHSIPDRGSAFRRRGLIAVAATSVGFSMLCIASSEPPAAQPAVVAATGGSPYATDPGDSQGALIGELSFPGGTVKQYVEAIEAAIKPLPLNVMFYDRAEQVLVGAIRLRSVSVGTAMKILNSEIANNSVAVQFGAGKVPGDQGVFFLRGQMNSVDANILRALTTSVYSLREWTVAESPDAAPLAESRRTAALGAIEQGLSFGIDSNPGPYFKPIVRYHPESGLLFVRASGQDQEIAASIVRKLEQSFRDADNSKKSEEDDQKRTLKMLSLEREVDVLRAKLDTAKKPPLLSGVVRVREDIRAKVLDVAREVTKQYGSIDGNLEISETPKGIQLKGPGDLVHYAVNAARAAAKVLGDDDAEFQEQSLPR